MAGLDPAIHGTACSTDARSKPGHDQRSLVLDPEDATTSQAGTAGQSSWTQMVLSSVYFSMAWSDLSRPKPDCL